MAEKKLVIKRGNTTILSFDEYPEGSIRSKELMDHDYIKIPFTLDTPIYFKLGDYCDAKVEYDDKTWNLGRFELTDMVRPKYNESSSGYEYELQLDAYYWKWKNKKMKFQPDSGASELSFALTASLSVHLNVFLKNLAALGKKESTYLYNGTTAFEVNIHSSVDKEKAQLVSYENFSLIEALNKYAELWECEWWVVDHVIHFGKCESEGTETTFELGNNVETMSQSDNKADYATRLYCFGSEKNLPANYRETSSDVTVNGVVQKRLMMPVGVPYLQDYNALTEQEAVEAVVIFDDIFPQVDCVVGDTNTYTKTVEEDDGTTTKQTFWRVSDSSGFRAKFTEDMILEGETLHIVFSSGSMNGMDFECQLIEKDEKLGKCFEIVMNETYGRKLPDSVLCPQKGDKYVIVNWDSTRIADLGLVAKAEKKLQEEGQKYLNKSKIDPNAYPCTMADDYIYNKGALRFFELGDKVKLVNPTFFANGRSSRIIGYKWPLDIPFDSAEYTVGEKAGQSRVGSLEGAIQAITLNGKDYFGSSAGGGTGVYVLGINDGTAPTDKNVLSSLRSLYSFLRKDLEDSARALIHLLKGATFGKFVHGWTEEGGKGARIDEDGNAEFESIRSRGFIETMELRFNRIDVVSGELWNSIAFGLIEEVDTEKQIVKLKLEDGELSGIKVGDICRGMFHNLTGNPTTMLREDECGFVQIAGFSPAYFTPTEVYDDGASFKYSLKAGTKQHPQVGMKFSVYGSFTDADRRASAYSNRYYKRYLTGVDTWVINPDKHIAFQSGLLEGLTISGVQMKGYGTFLNNVYMTGVNVQFNKEILDDLQGDDAYSVVLSQYEGVVLKDEEGNIINSNVQQVNIVSGDKNVTADDEAKNVITSTYALSTTIQASKGKKALIAGNAIEEGKFLVTLNAVGCTATTSNGVVYITSIDSTAAAHYVDITINCEGMRTFVVRYGISIVLQANGFITVDFDNEMSSFACDENGKLAAFSTVTANARMWNGNDRMIITYAEIVNLPEGISANYTLDNGKMKLPIGMDAQGNSVAILQITGFSESAAKLNNIEVAVTGKVSSSRTQTYTKSALFKLNKFVMGSNAVKYEILPNVDQIQVDKDGNITTNTLRATVLATDGKLEVKELTTASELGDDFYMIAELINQLGTSTVSGTRSYTVGSNIYMGYSFSTGTSNITFTKESLRVVFKLYYKSPDGDVLIDKEGVPLVKNGTNTVRIHLDNPVDSVLVNQDGTLAPSQAMPSTKCYLYDGEEQVTDSSKMNWAIELHDCQATLASSYNSDMSRTVNVTALSAVAGYVLVKCQYKTIWYSEVFSLKQLVGIDDYEIEVNPSQIIYDPNANSLSATSITCKVWRTGQSGARENIQSLPTGYKLGYSFITATAENGMDITDSYKNGQYVLSSGISSALSEIRWELYDKDGKNVNTKSVLITKQGTNGTNGQYYYLTAPVGTIGFTRAGYATPSSFRVQLIQKSGSITSFPTAYFKVFVWNGASWTNIYYSFNNQSVLVNSSPTNAITVNASDNTSYRQYLIRAYSSYPSNPANPNSDTVDYIAELAIGVALNGLQGENGENGYFPRDRGFFTQNERYYYRKEGDDVYRDKVVAMVGDHYYNFMVKTRDDSGYVTVAPQAIDGTDPYWEMMSQYQTLIADTLFGNNANIGGFMASNLMLKSSKTSYRVYYAGAFNYQDYYYYPSSQNPPLRPMVKYSGKFYVPKATSTLIHQNYYPTNANYWREANDEEQKAYIDDDTTGSTSTAVVDIPVFSLDGSTGIITMIQPDDTVWTYDETGRQLMGLRNGQRIEIAPGSKDISVFNASNKQVISINGETISSIDSMFQDNTGTATGTAGNASRNGGGTIGSVETTTTVVASGITVGSGSTQFTVKGTLKATANYTERSYGEQGVTNGAMPVPTKLGSTWYRFYNTAKIEVLFGIYNNGTFTALRTVATQNNGVCGNSASSTFAATFGWSGGATSNYAIAVRYALGCYAEIGNSASVEWSALSIEWASNLYLGQVFANGFVFGNSGNNFIAAVNEGNKMHFKGVVIDSSSNKLGFDLSPNGFRLLYNGFLFKPTITLFVGRIHVYNGEISTANSNTYFKSFDGNTVSASRSSQGRYQINLPSAWSSLNISGLNTFVTVMGKGDVTGNTNYYGSVAVVTNTYIQIMMGDDTSPNDLNCYVKAEYIP